MHSQSEQRAASPLTTVRRPDLQSRLPPPDDRPSNRVRTAIIVS
jgi:hypothetical protein